jgi:hypothetical protein
LGDGAGDDARAMTPTLADALHIAHGDAAADGLAAAGARHRVVRRDLLTVGPCDVDPERHRAARVAFWGPPPADFPTEPPGVDHDDALRAQLAAHAGKPVVVWATRAFSDLTYLWALVDALARVGAARPWLVRPAHADPTLAMGAITPDALLQASADVAPLDEAVARSCVDFWHAYAAADPTAFDQLRLRGAAVVPELGRILHGHSAWFPRRDGARLRLSDADAAIFAWAADGDFAHVRVLMNWIGDSSLYARVRAWREMGALGGDDRVPALSEAGRRLRDEGAASVAEFPPWWIGGCRVNDPAAPWVLVGERIVRDDRAAT